MASTEPLEPTFENLQKFTLDKSRKAIPRRRGSGHRSRIGVEIKELCESFLLRPMRIEDVNPDICELLVIKWKRSSMTGSMLKIRYQWFIDTNEVAFQLGWSDRKDFNHIQPTRSLDWQQTRQNVDLPEQHELPEIQPSEGSDFQKLTMKQLLDDYYIPARLVGKSQNTIRLYNICIRNFSKWLGRDAVVGDLNTQTTGRYLQHALEHTDLSPHTIEKEAAEFRSFWTFAAKKGWLPNFPEIPSINCPKRIPDAWSDEELLRLMQACENAPGEVGDVSASVYWPALVSVIYDCGERISAVLSITRSDIDSHGWLTVRGEYRKGKTRDKRFKLRPVTLERIEKLGRRGLVFTTPWNSNYIYRKFGEILESAGLPKTRRDKFHKIRRTTASNFEAAGGNATALLDHTDRRTTEAYLDPRVLNEVQPADIVPGIEEKKGVKP